MRGWIALLAGVSPGLLLGVLVGLAASPVVGSVVGGLVTLLATFLGLRETKGDEAALAGRAREDDLRRLTLAGFGVACLGGLFWGLYLRTHEVLSPSVSEQVKRWTDASYDEQQARALVALRLVGLVPAGATARTPSQADQAVAGVLFAGAREQCDAANPQGLSNAAAVAGLYRTVGSPWAQYAKVIARQPEQTRLDLLRAGWALVCS